MASAKSGKKISTVAPTDPEDTFDADQPDPVATAEVKAEQIEKEKGKYGSTKMPPYKVPEEEEVELTWLEVELVDEDDNPVPGEPYKIETEDGFLIRGTLDENGFSRHENLRPGKYEICFPRLDEALWEPI